MRDREGWDKKECCDGTLFDLWVGDAELGCFEDFFDGDGHGAVLYVAA